MNDPAIALRPVDDLDAHVIPRDWAFARDNAARVEAHWRSRLASKPALFDGRVMLMSRADYVVDGGRRVMRSAHFETSFSAFMAWRDFGFPDASVRNCFSMAALRGDDGGFILAEMGAHTSNAGQIYFPAGTPDPHDVVGDRLDLDGSARRELEEETGLRADEATFATDWLLVDAGPRLACMKLVEVGAPADEVAGEINRRIAAQTSAELAGVRVVRDARDINPARMPAFVVAYLRHMFAARPA